MKRFLRTATALALTLALALALAACALPGGEDEATATPSDAQSDARVYTDEERAQIAAKVGDYEITKGELINEYESMLSYYTAYGLETPTAAADIESYQDYALSGMVLEKLILQQGTLLGVNPLTAEQEAEVAAQADEFFAGLIEQYESQAAGEGAENVSARALEIINETLDQNGWNMNYDAYQTWYRQYVYDQKVAALTEEAYKQAIALTDEELTAYYDEQLLAQKELFEKTPAEYVLAAEDAEMNGATPALVVPEGFVRVKAIAVTPEGEVDASYSEMTASMTALEAEYGQLSLDTAVDHSARLAEISTEYAQLKTDSEAIFTEYSAAARTALEEALEKLKSGASFDEVLLAYGEDDAYGTYEAIGQKGRLMYLGGADDTWAPALQNAVRGLEAGAYSEILSADGKLYIIQYVGPEEARTLTLDDAREALAAAAKAEKAETAWSEAQETWLNDTSLVEYFEDVYRDIGK